MALSSHIKRFKFIGDLEGISYLLLLGIAMPLKYIAHYPAPVKYTGAAHGALFVLFIILILETGIKEKWKIQKFALALISSFLPFGTFIFNKKFL
jgi:integral membrane protein